MSNQTDEMELPEQAQASNPHAESESSPVPPAPILTVEAGGVVETEESMAELVWHEIHNAYRTRRILTGFLGGLEQTDAGKTLAIVEYKGFRVVIPLKEMVIGIPNHLSGKAYSDMILSYNKLLSNMMGCEIDFVIKGIDAKSRSIVASRKEAMLRKRKDFYFEPDDNGSCRVYPGRVIQVRVILVAEKAIRIEAFGVECTIIARNLSWDWIGDINEVLKVGEEVEIVGLKETKKTVEEMKAAPSDPQLAGKYTEEDAKKDITAVYGQTGLKLVKMYGPSVLLGAASIGCIVTSHGIVRKCRFALAAAYASVDKGFKEYRGRVIERFGEELDRELKYNIKKQEIQEVVTDENGNETTVTKTVDVAYAKNPDSGSPYARFFDDGCTGWSKDPEHNLYFLRSQESFANDKLKEKGIKTLTQDDLSA